MLVDWFTVFLFKDLVECFLDNKYSKLNYLNDMTPDDVAGVWFGVKLGFGDVSGFINQTGSEVGEQHLIDDRNDRCFGGVRLLIRKVDGS